MNKKTIAIFAVCMLLVSALSVFATLALLSDTKTITNTFTSGNVHIKLDESLLSADKMTAATGDEADRVSTSQEYKVFPGQECDKDPMITVLANSEECYVGAVISISNANALQTSDIILDDADDADATDIMDLLSITVNSDWVLYNSEIDANVTTVASEAANADPAGAYVFYYTYKEAVASSTVDQPLTKLFETFEVVETADNTIVGKLNGLEIKVTGYASQAQTFNSAAESLEAAFETVFDK